MVHETARARRDQRVDIDGALNQAYRRPAGFARVVIGLFLPMDLAFKSLIIPGYLEAVGRRADGTSRLALCLKAGAIALSAWAVVAWLVTRAVDRWRGGAAIEAAGSADDPRARTAILEAGLAAQRFPQQIAIAWSAEWLLLFVSITVLGGSPSVLVSGFFCAAMASGPLPLAHSLGAWLVGPVTRGVSLAARTHGVAIPAPPLTLRGRLVFYCLGLCLAPVFYMAAVVFAARAPSEPAGHLLMTVLIFFAAIVLFALLCATLLATTITGPVAEMAAVMRAIARQGDVARVGRVPLYQRDEVGALAEVTNQMIDRLEATETSRASAARALAALNQTLERRVELRTAELTSRNADMRLVLDNVDQGFFTVDRAGAMSPEQAAILTAWFGPVASGEPMPRYFGRHDGAFAANLELAWEQLVDDVIPLELALAQLPRHLAARGRRFRLSYAAIGAEPPARFLVVVSDETQAIEHEELQRERKEMLSLFEHMLADRSGFIGFMDEASEIMARVIAARTGDSLEIRRALHTLKGNAALFGLQSVAEICHELESRLIDERMLPDAEAFARLEDRWSRVSAQVERLLGQGRHVIEVSPEQVAALERAARAGNGSNGETARLIHELTLEPIERRLRHFGEQAARIGQRLSKEIAVRISHDGLRLDARECAKLWQAFVHAVRNAVDHGIEPADERAAAAKPRAGRIDLRGRRDGASVVIEIEDDGRGIPWDEVRLRVRARGVTAPSRQELVAALFADGISTAREVTETSGRGLGMGALHAAVQALGGDLEIDSEPGRGTCVRLRFPEAAVRPTWLRS